MREYTWLEVSTPKPPNCPVCLVIMEEEVALSRKFKMMQEGLASVRWSCAKCGFAHIGEFFYEPDKIEARDLNVDQAILQKIGERKRNGYRPADPQELMSLGDPRADPRLRKRLVGIEPPAEFKTDQEALAAVYPHAIPGDELFRLLENFWPDQMDFARRSIERATVEMGERGAIDEVTVSYQSDAGIIFSQTYSSTDGPPTSLDEDLKTAAKAMLSATKGPPKEAAITVGRKSPREFPGYGVHINRHGQFEDITRQDGLPSTGAGYQKPSS